MEYFVKLKHKSFKVCCYFDVFFLKHPEIIWIHEDSQKLFLFCLCRYSRGLTVNEVGCSDFGKYLFFSRKLVLSLKTWNRLSDRKSLHFQSFPNFLRQFYKVSSQSRSRIKKDNRKQSNRSLVEESETSSLLELRSVLFCFKIVLFAVKLFDLW